MPEADTEDRTFSQQRAYVLDRVVNRCWIARAVAQKDAVGIHGQDFVRRRPGRHHLDAQTTVRQHAQDIALNAVVVSYDKRPLRQRAARTVPLRIAFFQPVIGLGDRHGIDEIGPGHVDRAGGDLGQAGGIFRFVAMRNSRAHDPFLADVAAPTHASRRRRRQ